MVEAMATPSKGDSPRRSSTLRIAYEMAPLINLNNIGQLSSIAVVGGGERLFTGGYDGKEENMGIRAS